MWLSELEKLAAKRMRMLRLGEGWSAEKLSQEYGTGGAGVLTRTTIAKIESDKRQIKAGEVEGVAKVFGLTSADLLDPDGPNVFLSYAEQDDTAGHEIAGWLADHGFRVLSAGLPAADDPGPGSGGARVVDAAHAFVVLLSPSFLSSPRCQQELDLAVRREQHLLSAGLAADFIYVLQVGDEPVPDDSGLQSHPLIDLALDSDRSKEVALSKLGGSIISSARTSPAQSNPPAHVQASQSFLNRSEDLERVLYALSNPSGEHFWLVISPPGLGKSWFLGQLEAIAAESAPDGCWVTSMVDLRHGEKAGWDAAGRQDDAMTVVRRLFGLEQLQSSGPEDDLRVIAQQIIRSGRPWLCLLDSAELLTARAVAQLRQHLGKISRLIQDSGTVGARLACVVASRRDDGWKGITPYPRLSVLPLAGFGPSAVQDALEKLARRMPGVHSPAELRKDGELVQRVTEGVPELVQQSLQWIEAEEWLEIERLDGPQLFGMIIAPYVRDRLLAQDGLLPAEEGQPGELAEQLDALQSALRALVPYRLFTLYHVYHHLDNDRSFSDALKEANWSAEDLWQAIGDMALLQRPLDEAWQEIHPAIRRLLYRYFYASEERAEAHLRARDFTRDWAGRLSGKDQVTGMVESIWHEAVRLRLSSVATMGEDLTGFARMLSRDVRPSAYTESELRAYAVERMKNDDELQREIADVQGLFEKLVGVVLAPAAREA